jgi:tetratricopeptide (TPR) repeat protein
MCIGQSPEDLFREGNNAYNQGDYERAITYYDSISSMGVHAAELYFNLGNAYYKQNSIAPSILNYEKAILLDADNEQVRNNLTFAQNMTLDRFSPLPESDLKKATDRLLFLTSIRGWSIAVVMCIWLVALLFFLYLKSAGSGMKRLFFSGFILAAFGALLALTFALQQQNIVTNTRPAIVFAQEESFRAEPNLRSEVLLSVHEGTKVFVQDQVEDWVKVKLKNGAIGWIPKSSVQPISFVEK